MTESEFDEWSEYHGDLFQLHGENDKKMFSAWKPLMFGYYLAEAVEASNWIAGNSAATFRTQHLELIQRRISFKRTESYRQNNQDDAQERAMRCKTCFGRGYLACPHPKAVSDGGWTKPRYTVAVFCLCSKGSAKRSSLKVASIGLDEYEVIVPHWQELLASAEEQRCNEDAAKWAASEADRSHGPMAAVVNRLLRSAKR